MVYMLTERRWILPGLANQGEIMNPILKTQIDLILSQLGYMDVNSRREIFLEVGKHYCIVCGRPVDPSAPLSNDRLCSGPHNHFE